MQKKSGLKWLNRVNDIQDHRFICFERYFIEVSLIIFYYDHFHILSFSLTYRAHKCC